MESKLQADGTFPITITVDDASRIEMIKGGTVREVLSEYGVAVSDNDLIIPPLGQELREFDEIAVIRREQEVFTEEEVIPYTTNYYYSPDVRPGQETVKTEGENGLKVETYSQLLVKGEVQEEKLVSRDVVKAPVNKEILIGYKSIPISPLDFDWGFDENGEPQNCKTVLRSTSATGYNAPDGAKTSTGMPAKVGHVAVNPNVIPYGSKLFIQSPDGRFVYGYAIAADTGSALLSGSVGVDLFYATYAQSAANGVREVDIFVLE